MTRIKAVFVVAVLLAVSMSQAHAQIRYEEILELGKHFEPKAFEFSEQTGTEIIPTKDGRSFVLRWQPENFDPKTSTVFVSLHGHGGWAQNEPGTAGNILITCK